MSGRARGADFSSAQTLEQVVEVARHIDFAFVKASEGVDYVNPLLHSMAHTLKTAGVLVGYYHFLDPGPDGAEQWDYFERAIAGDVLRGPVCLDFEAKGATAAQAKAFIARGRDRGCRVGVYGSASTCRRRLGQSWRWVASWSSKPPPGTWHVWQFTSTGNRQDYDVFNGDVTALKHWWLKQTKTHAPRPRWWLRDDTTGTAHGSYRLAGRAAAAFLLYARRHPHSTRYTLEHK